MAYVISVDNLTWSFVDTIFLYWSVESWSYDACAGVNVNIQHHELGILNNTAVMK